MKELKDNHCDDMNYKMVNLNKIPIGPSEGYSTRCGLPWQDRLVRVPIGRYSPQSHKD